MNIVERIFANADPGAPALITNRETLSYRALQMRVEAAAAQLPKGWLLRIALDCPSGITHIVLALAIVRAGHCLIPLAPELTGTERQRILRDTSCAAVLTADMALHRLEPPAPQFPVDAFEALAPAFVRFSSGTTGQIKGVVLSHETLLRRVRCANAALEIGPADRVLWVLPMAHHFAVSIILYLIHGAAAVLVENHDGASMLTDAVRHSATVFYGAPFHHAQLASAITCPDELPPFRLAVSTAAPLPEATARAFHSRFGIPVTQGLGAIEAGLPLLNLISAATKPLAVGRPVPGFEAKLGAESDLLVRGPGMLDAYLLPWRTREQILDDGWFRTGDLASCDADGDYLILGRRSNVINVGGLKCFPEEIESVLLTCPGVSAARVSARNHSRFGTVPVAEIVPGSDEAPSVRSLIRHCRQELAAFKIPVDFIFVTELPKTASGKVSRLA